MGIFGRSRANTTSNAISQPVLTFSDAAPRDDLQKLGVIESPLPPPKVGKSAGRTRTASDEGRQGYRQKPQNVAPQEFDFTVTEPLEPPPVINDPASFHLGMNSNGIGIALGSPSMVALPPQYRPINWDEPATSTAAKPEPISSPEPGSLRRKQSKWKAFGGLLKGKQNDGKRMREGFYQLDAEKSQDEDSVSGFQQRAQRTKASEDSDRRRENMSTTSPSSSPQLRKASEDSYHVAPTNSLLEVDIPTIQMERYSVMFRSVLGEKPSSNLLARRSKTLGQLQVSGTEPPLPELYKPQRRATSPSTTTRPSEFTLFPSVSQGKTINNNPHENGKIGASQYVPKNPIRSNTFPSVATVSRSGNSHSHLTVPDLTPALSTGTSSGYSSEEPSPIPYGDPTTTRDYINGRSEPVWEMVTKQQPVMKSYTIISSPDVSARPTPTTATPLIQEEQEEDEHDTSPKTRPRRQQSPLILPPRKASLPAYAEKSRTKARIAKNEAQILKEKEDKSPLLAPNNNKPLPPTIIINPPPHLARAQTMPLPAKPDEEQKPAATTQTQSWTPKQQHKPSQSPNPEKYSQTVEISVARSVSVSRRVPKQTLVPLGATPQAFHNANEKFGEHQIRVPTLVDAARPGGIRRQKSQDIVIESL